MLIKFIKKAMPDWQPENSSAAHTYAFARLGRDGYNFTEQKWLGQFVCFGRMKNGFNRALDMNAVVLCPYPTLLKYNCDTPNGANPYARYAITNKQKLVDIMCRNAHIKFICTFINQKGVHVGHDKNGHDWWAFTCDTSLPWWKYQLCLFVMRGLANMKVRQVNKLLSLNPDSWTVMKHCLAVPILHKWNMPVDSRRLGATIVGEFQCNLDANILTSRPETCFKKLKEFLKGEQTELWARDTWNGRKFYDKDYLTQPFKNNGNFAIGQMLTKETTVRPEWIGNDTVIVNNKRPISVDYEATIDLFGAKWRIS